MKLSRKQLRILIETFLGGPHGVVQVDKAKKLSQKFSDDPDLQDEFEKIRALSDTDDEDMRAEFDAMGTALKDSLKQGWLEKKYTGSDVDAAYDAVDTVDSAPIEDIPGKEALTQQDKIYAGFGGYKKVYDFHEKILMPFIDEVIASGALNREDLRYDMIPLSDVTSLVLEKIAEKHNLEDYQDHNEIWSVLPPALYKLNMGKDIEAIIGEKIIELSAMASDGEEGGHEGLVADGVEDVRFLNVNGNIQAGSENLIYDMPHVAIRV